MTRRKVGMAVGMAALWAAGGAWACWPCLPQKASASGSATEAAVTTGGLVDAAIAAEPAKAKRAGKKGAKPAAEAKYECPSCKMAFDKPGDCPTCKTSLVPKKPAPQKS